jgi:hypothetical protein
MPADRHLVTAAGTEALGGSTILIRPTSLETQSYKYQDGICFIATFSSYEKVQRHSGYILAKYKIIKEQK